MIEVCPLKNVVIFVEVDESNNNGFCTKKFCSGQIGVFWAQKWHILITLDPP